MINKQERYKRIKSLKVEYVPVEVSQEQQKKVDKAFDLLFEHIFGLPDVTSIVSPYQTSPLSVPTKGC